MNHPHVQKMVVSRPSSKACIQSMGTCIRFFQLPSFER